MLRSLERTGTRARSHRGGHDSTSMLHAIDTLASSGANLTMQLVDVEANVEAISSAAQAQTATFHQVRDSTAQLLAMTHEVATAAGEARMSASSASTAAVESHARIGAALEDIQQLARSSADAAKRLDAVLGALNELRQVTAAIAAISNESRILALNAKIEAARSGSTAFLVIASNVQDLADRIMTSAQAADAGMGDLVSAVDALADTSHTSAEKASVVQSGTGEIRADLLHVVEAIQQTDRAAGWIAEGIGEAEKSLAEVDSGMAAVMSQAEQTSGNLGEARDRLKELRDISRNLLGVRAEAGIPCTDTRMIEVTRDGAARLQAAFEEAVASGRLSIGDLFDDNYTLIEGSNPPQYRTRFSDFTDKVAPPVQEPILEGSPLVDGSCLHDRNGYRPTMNLKYAQPQGSDPAWNQKHARTKSLAKDDAGLSAARNTQPYLLQAYRRTANGSVQLMRDVSVPIFVSGRHWGCLRTVYAER